MFRTLVAASAAVVVFAGCRTATVQSDTAAPAPPPGAAAAVVPTGTQLVVELDQALTTKSNKVGDRFTATVKEDVSAGGNVVVPAGSKVAGRVTGVDDSDRVGDQAALRLAFESITINGRVHAFNAEVTDVDVDLGDRAGISDVREKAGVGAAAGAVLGAVIGGSLKDILIGGVLGAGAGTIISLGLGDVEAALPQGSDLTLRVTQQVSMR